MISCTFRAFFYFTLSVLPFTGLSGTGTTTDSVLSAYEDSLCMFTPLVLNSKTDSEKMFFNDRVTALLLKALERDNSFFYSFDKVKSMAILSSPDKRFRIFNWHLPENAGSYRYFGIIQFYDKKSERSFVYELQDKSGLPEDWSKRSVTGERWYGAHYYRIILSKRKGVRYYTLLGWKGYNSRTTKKVIDVMIITNPPDSYRGYRDYIPIFGAPVFTCGKDTTSRRIIFEYSAMVSMSVQWDEKKKRIVFDHLSPGKPEYAGNYEFYGPDFSCDAFKFKRGRWTLIEDVDARNPEDKKSKKTKIPEKGLLPEKTKK
ncbi:MAG: hypothetical protein HYY40_09150 [Bacteroidetes bacterium]|nr:hypothetical protein [Bacteroidota bacterium]